MKSKSGMKIKVSLDLNSCFSTVSFELNMSSLKSPWILFGACNTSMGWWRCGNIPKISLIHLNLLLWKHPVRPLVQLPLALLCDLFGFQGAGESLQHMLVYYQKPVCFPPLPSIFPSLFNFPVEDVYPEEDFLNIWMGHEVHWRVWFVSPQPEMLYWVWLGWR